MDTYYVNSNAQPNGDHEVHKAGCRWLPEANNRVYLGAFDGCLPAVLAARAYYGQVNGCVHCSPACHTR